MLFKTWTLISIYIHACFSSVDQHSINIPTRLKNRSFTFPSWSFSVKVNTVYTFISFELQQCMDGRIIVAFIPMVNYPTNEMALTKIDYRSLESKRFLKWYCTNDASNRQGWDSKYNLFRIISMWIFVFISFYRKKKKRNIEPLLKLKYTYFFHNTNIQLILRCTQIIGTIVPSSITFHTKDAKFD